MKRGGALRRGAPLARRTRLAPINRARRARAHADAFGPRAEYVREAGCVIARAGHGGCEGPVESHHEPPRSVRRAGLPPMDRRQVGLCRCHHAIRHDIGLRSFSVVYGVDLKAEAARIAVELDEMGLP